MFQSFTYYIFWYENGTDGQKQKSFQWYNKVHYHILYIYTIPFLINLH